MVHTTGNISSSTTTRQINVEQEISRIKRENQNIYNNLTTLESEERIVIKSKSEQLIHLAKNYERLHELGDYPKDINHICADICWELGNRKLGASASLARAVLPEKYKQTEFAAYSHPGGFVATPTFTTPTQQQQQHQPQEPQIDYSSILIPSIVTPEPTKSTDLMTPDELRNYTEDLITKERQAREALLETRRRAREAKEKCEQQKIALSPDFEQDHEPHHSAQSADSGPSEAWEACLEFRATIDKLADKLYRWRPNKQLAKDLKFAFEEEIEFYKPFIDEKYRKSQPSWWVVQLHNIYHGKHAAAIMNSTPIDEKTKRSLTREQVGDKYEEDLKRALRFVAAQKVKAKLWWWFVEYNEKGIAKRAKDLNPVLSEKSFT